MTRNTFRFLIPSLCAIVLAGFVAGCGGGGGSDNSSGGGTYTPAPKDLTGGTMVVTYADGRSFTLYFDNSSDTGIRRSDGKTSTAWTVSGLGGATLTLNISYGTVATGTDAANNVYDGYTFAFATKTTGDLSLRENTTFNTYSSTPVTKGTFTFTVYPPNG